MTLKVDSAQLGSLIRRFRIAAALSQEELAERSTVSVRTISDLERGVRSTARLETVRLLAAALELKESERLELIHAATEGAEASQTPVASGTIVSSLPASPNQLIGRKALVADVVGQLAGGEVRILTLSGPGGVGKTRVAIEAATEFAKQTGIPAVFVPLAPVTDAAMVPAAVAQALGFSATVAAPDEVALNSLSKRRLLLLVDNAEHLPDAAPFFARLSNASLSGCVLVTSRSRLQLSVEREYPVPPLTLPKPDAGPEEIQRADAVQLFADRAAGQIANLDLLGNHAGTVAEICRRLDGLPLCIELAATKLRVVSPPTLLEMLEHRLPLLTGGNRDLPERQQSMRATIAWSYELLREQERRLFRWLAVYVDGFSIEAVLHTGAALGFTRLEVFDALDGILASDLAQRLQDRSDVPRYRMLETIREYGIEQLCEEHEIGAARLSHARFVYDLVAEGAAAPVLQFEDEWFVRVKNEDANLTAAFDWACTPETAELCIELASVAGGYWDVQGPYRESARRMRKAAALAAQVSSLSAARTMFWASGLSNYAGEYEIAPTYGEAALHLAQELGSVQAMAFGTHTLAWNAELTGRLDEATELFGRALELWNELGEEGPKGQILMLLGGIALTKGDLTKAKELEEAARTIFERASDADYLASIEWYLGFIAMSERSLPAAAMHFKRSLELGLEGLSQSVLYKPLLHLSAVAGERGDWETAATLLGCSDHAMEKTGSHLFPLDKPVRERVEAGVVGALGNERFAQLCAASLTLGPSDWIELANEVVARTELQPVHIGESTETLSRATTP